LATLIGTIATVLFRSTTLVLAMRAIEQSDEAHFKNDDSSSPLLFSQVALPIFETSEAI
jgi:hypothetical protein